MSHENPPKAQSTISRVASRPTTAATRALKLAARQGLSANFGACAIVSLLAAILIWPIASPSVMVSGSFDILSESFRLIRIPDGQAFLDTLRAGLDHMQQATSVGSSSDAGVISSLYHRAQASGSIEKALVVAAGHALFGPSLSASVIAAAAGLVTLAVALLIRVPLRVSSHRFFLETCAYPKTSISSLLFVFRRRRVMGVAAGVAYRDLRLLAWMLTIVMGPVKYYSYAMVEFILAENPDVSPRQALRLSQAMMRGRRWRAFLLDLSFLQWYLLGLVTFGLVTILYAIPYRSLAWCELYTQAREEQLTLDTADSTAFDDPYLIDPATPARLMADGFVFGDLNSESYPKPWTPHALDHLHYARDYSPLNLVLLFFSFSVIGWVYESVTSLAYVGHFVNRGTLYGPWIPIYGVGGVAALVLLKPIRDNPVATFFTSMLVCGVIEYIAATALLKLTGLQYWTYQGYFFNIQGRVCLEGLIVFGLGCTAAIYFLAPLLDTWLRKVPRHIRIRVACVLATGFMADILFTWAHPRTGDGITS
ncbi:MAG: DUF975 family protein [Propionibacteriaceae bacterium]|jgi:hypothetical protein|nr:DUF975 family protein [Propionibacteriaceae bacterium]